MKGDRLGEFEEVVLLAVRLVGADANAVDIQEALKAEARRQASLGSLYNVLDRLERKGLVESWLGEPRRVAGGRRRRCYKLTKDGKKTLEEVRRVRDRLWVGSTS